ncbi:MAG: hypothetical protein IPH09_15180 [bacterium]|nr:hypothetical protein [bacterium]
MASRISSSSWPVAGPLGQSCRMGVVTVTVAGGVYGSVTALLTWVSELPNV